MDELEKAYWEKTDRILQNYQLGLAVALDELEKATDDKISQDLLRTWYSLKTHSDKQRYGKSVSDQILRHTGRGYLVEQVPAMDSLLQK